MAAVSKLKQDSKPAARSYSANLYIVVLSIAAVCAFGAVAYQATRGVWLGVAAMAVYGAGMAAVAWSFYTAAAARFDWARLLHLGGLAFGAVLLALWLFSTGGQLSTAMAGGVGLGEAWDDIALDTLPLADAILLLAINGGALPLVAFLRKQAAEQASHSLRQSMAEQQTRRFLNNNSARLGGVIVLALFAITYFMPRVDPYTGITVIRDGNLALRLAPPDCLIGWIRVQQGVDAWDGPSPSPLQFPCTSPFGYDKNGRDTTRRVLHGISVSLAVSVTSVALALSIGGAVGLLAGYYGGGLDSVFMRIMDVMLAFPSLLLAIAIVAVRGPGLDNTMVAIAIVSVPIYARLARAMAITARQQEFVTAGISLGARNGYIILRYILPNSLAPLIVQSTLGLGTAVIETAALGFLGLGQQPPFPELGKMLSDSQEVLLSGSWWVMLFPGITVMLIVLGFNLLGDALRDTLDPKLRGR
jgi:peptide/nickel transport system permease protein